MNDTITVGVPNIIINQIPDFYNKFTRYNSKPEYKFYYKGILFNYFKTSSTLTAKTNTGKILGRIVITESDIDEYIEKVTSIIKEIVNVDEITLNVCRFDYKVDIPLTNQEMDYVFKLLNKHRLKYRYIKVKRIYKTSIHLSSPCGSYNINIYDKGIESRKPIFKNVLRIELQIKKRGIQRLLKIKGKPRKLYEYWNRKSMGELFFKYFEGFLYKGDYYQLGEAIKIIENSKYSKTLKKGLISFVSVVSNKGMSGAEKVFGYMSIRNYEKLLNNINLSPVTIEENAPIEQMENLLKKARRIAETEYFK